MRAIALIAIVAAAACSDPPDDERDAGSSTTPDAQLGFVEPGTGLERFEQIAPGQLMELIRGPQGGGQFFGYHIWSAARVEDYPFEVARVIVKLIDAESGQRRALLERNSPLLVEGVDKVVYGLAPRIDDCCKVQTRELIMRVEIETADGPFAANESRVVAGMCLDRESMPICP